MIVDRQGRGFRNLRVSLTAACNYACTYCVPNGRRLVPAERELPADRLAQAVELLIAAAGIDKLRITGGEPLVTPKFDQFLAHVTRLGLDDISITTNGQLLARKVPVLVDCGLKRINVSLDTLDAERFRAIARGGDLHTVLDGIETALAAGLRVKVNMVPLRRANHDQILPLLDWCLARGIELRYIELMRMGHLARGNDFALDYIPMQEILDLIATRHDFERTEAPFDSTSIRFAIPGAASGAGTGPGGVFGVIANESEPFCSSCTRLRLSSEGWLYGCLSNARRHYMGDLLDLPEGIALARLQELLTAALGDKQSVAFAGEVTVMKLIGG
jgi:cyclic pyranopterin phosphate synthase